MHDTEKKIPKSELAKRAGFSDISSVKKNIESSNYFQGKVGEIVGRVGIVTEAMLEAILEDVNIGKHLELSLEQKTRLFQVMVNVNKALLPTIKQKEVRQEEDGVRTTIWKTLN